ncbi:bifunctional diguanylate cyclase/phosphodiesterase [Oceanicoccus sp. KOV_DT_Chl]|uniref:putative bifunctional diguanylate cyclase/phosphodiesterase n=1 Tax=Oceanicoccus sp. KOV_DT_Chl TaxID=1904639 RepID=UPI000C79586B|nr:EAL domain-containing protein [Oceanicoccus sp. KOV_DT_Chl]
MLFSAASQILPGQLKTVFGFYPIAITSSLLLVLLNTLMLSPLEDVGFHAWLWFGAAVLISIVRYQFYLQYLRAPLSRSLLAWLFWHTVFAAITGLVWGYAVLWLMPADSMAHQLFFIIAIAGVCSGASSTLSLTPLAFIFFMASCLVPLSTALYFLDKQTGWWLVSLCYIYMIFMWTTCLRNYQTAYQNLQQSCSLDEQQQALIESRRRLDLHFDRSPLGIIEWDIDFSISRWNPAAELIFGRPSAAMLGQNFSKLSMLQQGVEYFEKLTAAEHFLTATLASQTGDGKTINCEWTSVPMRLADQQLVGYTSFVRDVTKRIQREELITRQAYYDAVTDLPNRNYFQDRLQQKISMANRTRQYNAVFFVDLDHFKDINDSMGHSFGDIVLAQFAKRLQARLRQYDTLARFGGDEFVVLLEALDPDYEQSQLMSAQVARSLQLLLQDPFKLDDTEYSLTCSVGITLFNSDQCSEDELLRQADLALYESKRKGRNNYTFFETEMSQQAARHLQLLNSLRGAISRDEMSLVYQPKVSMRDNTLMGAEALLRWNNQDFGAVSPAEFIPVLEGSALISQVGLWVLESSFQQLAQWMRDGLWHSDMRLAINISPKQLLEAHFVEQVEAALAVSELPASLIEFEITENVLVENVERVGLVLATLNQLGISFSIDDFGTGYSSLAYLKQLPIDVLKIDKSFIDHCTEEGNDQAIVRSILSICNELGLTSVAEGVETALQQQLLQKMGCDLLQGYLFSRPIAAADFAQLLVESPRS